MVGCAFALAMDKPTTIHIDFVLSRVRMLLDFGVTPYLVFDGDNLPSKAGTNAARRKKREESRALGLELHKAGRAAQAQQELQKAIDVTPLMARQLIEELKKLNVQYIVAPYEADAQLVYLEQKGIIDGILAEDSDMLVFGAKRLLTKLNQYGELVEIERADFTACKDISLAGWTDTMFRRMAILSGCDYLPNIGKLGLKTAHGLVRKYNDVDKILRMVQLEGKLIVPAGYQDAFQHAELTFLHHRVFCPLAQRMVFLNDLTPGLSDADMPYLGPHVDPETALGVACGDLDPFSKRPMQLNKSLVRPALGDRKRQSYASAPELKPKKSIETFFKPYREPLAELDPNSLTPSPSQQRLLERNRNASWAPRMVSSAPALRRSTTVMPTPSDSTDLSTFLARASTVSTYQPPKRQRLCSVQMDASPSRELKESPFFSSNNAEPSPLAQKVPKMRKGRKSKFEIFSDDNTEILQMHQAEQAATPEPDRSPEEIEETEPLGSYDTQESIPQSSPIAKSSYQNGSPANGDGVPGSNAVKQISQDDDPDTFVDLLEFHVAKQNKALKKSMKKGSLMETFACQAQQSRDQALQSLSHVEPGQQTYFTASAEVQLAALRKLPKSGEIESFCKEVKQHKTWHQASGEVQQSALESLDRRPSSAKAGRQHAPANAKLARATTKTSTVIRGSEDSVVPSSEDEVSEAGASPKPKFDMSAFAFVSA